MEGNKRKLNKLKISIVLFVVIMLIAISVFGRYFYNSIRDSYLASRNFYFTSNLLDVNFAEYNFNNWDGQDPYEINFDLYSYDAKLRKVDYDLNYSLTCSVSDDTKAKCTIGSVAGGTSSNGIIYKSNNNKSSVKLYVSPLTDESTGESLLAVGDEVEVLITAKTTTPYAKEISARYVIEVSGEYSDYSISDAANQIYLTLQLVNPDTTAKTMTVTIDPATLRFDMSDAVYPIIASKTTDSNGYINQFTFELGAGSSRNIKFYKVNASQNYTYPNAGATSIIEVEAE